MRVAAARRTESFGETPHSFRCQCNMCLYVSIEMEKHNSYHHHHTCICAVHCTIFRRRRRSSTETTSCSCCFCSISSGANRRSSSPVVLVDVFVVAPFLMFLLCALSGLHKLGGISSGSGSQFMLLAEAGSLEDVGGGTTEPSLVHSVIFRGFDYSHPSSPSTAEAALPVSPLLRSTPLSDSEHGKGPGPRMCGSISCVGMGMIVLFGGLCLIAVLVFLYCCCCRTGKSSSWCCDVDDCCNFCNERSRRESIIVIPSPPIDPSQFSDSSIGKRSHYSDTDKHNGGGGFVRNKNGDDDDDDDNDEGNEHVKQISSAVFRESITSRQFHGEHSAAANGPNTTPNFHAFAPRNAPKKQPDVSIMNSLSALLLTKEEKAAEGAGNQGQQVAQSYQPPLVPSSDPSLIRALTRTPSRSPSRQSSAELKSAVLMSARATAATAANDASAIEARKHTSKGPVVREISADETEAMNRANFSLDTDEEEDNDSSSSDSQPKATESPPPPNEKPSRIRASISTPGNNGLLNGAGSTQGNTARSDDNSSSDDSDTLEYLTNYSARKTASQTQPLGQSRSCPYLPLHSSMETSKVDKKAVQEQTQSTNGTRSSSTDTSSSLSTTEADEIALEASIRSARQRSSTTNENRAQNHSSSSRRENSTRQPLQPLYNGPPRPLPVKGRMNGVQDDNAETHPSAHYAKLLPEEHLRNIPLSGHTREERSNTVMMGNGGYAGNNYGGGNAGVGRAHSAPGRDELLYIPIGPRGEGRFEISQEERDSLLRSRKWLVFHDVDGMEGFGD